MEIGDRIQVINNSPYTGMFGEIVLFGAMDRDAVVCRMDATGNTVRFNTTDVKVVCDLKANKYHDSHYQKLAVQPIEVMQMILTPEEFIGFLKGQIIKYSMRAGLKEGENVQKERDKIARYFSWLKIKVNGGVIRVK